MTPAPFIASTGAWKRMNSAPKQPSAPQPEPEPPSELDHLRSQVLVMSARILDMGDEIERIRKKMVIHFCILLTLAILLHLSR